MNLQQAIGALVERRDLSGDEMTAVMRQIMTGEATDAQIGAFLAALRMKGETVAEVAGAAKVMRDLSARVEVDDVEHLVDTCGTGGDAASTFNVSTAAAFVVAAAGAHVAKHGNRSVSSSCGSADLLEAAGVNLELSPEQVGECIRRARFGFLFAPAHHQAMRYAVGPRKELGVRTVFNVLGPLTNPAGAPNQVVGVYADEWVEHVAHVLGELGSRHVMVVHAADGLDEISIGAETSVAEFRDDGLETYTIAPEDFGITRAAVDGIRVGSAEESLQMIRACFAGETGPAHDIIALNAGAAIYVAGVTASLGAGVDRAREVMANGAARERLDEVVRVSNAL